ncbi:hypothetical protein H0H93_004946 [Arthromyces matolae]|nr:hypothetical protein H0H93_004946 [Arthromyces matolae]
MSSIVLKRTGQKTVYQAIKAGYRLLDGAGDYGNEKEAGEGLWNTFHARDHVIPVTKKQLGLWGIDYFDLFLIHFPISLEYVDPDHRYPPEWFDDNGRIIPENTPLQETWVAMEDLVDEGYAKNIGLSNCTGSLVLDVLRYARIEPQVLQVEHHPYLVQTGLTNLAKTLGIAVTAYSSLGPQGYFELSMDKGAQSLLRHDVITQIASKHKKTPAQVLLRWATQRGIAVVPKSNKVERLRENLLCNSFELDDDEIRNITALNINLRISFPTIATSTTMVPVNFKLIQLNGLTRRLAFSDVPSWSTLAAKIELLFNIPVEKVSVSYTDADNDQVTLSSQEELVDFYGTHNLGEVIKFTVQDLSTARLQRNFSQSSRNPARNTFGIFDIEDDWQTLPVPTISDLQGIFLPNQSQTHAFLEAVASDAGTVKGDIHSDGQETIISSANSSSGGPFISPFDKGKQREVPDDDVSSTGSVLGEDAPPKPPVHVFDFQISRTPDPISNSATLQARPRQVDVQESPASDNQETIKVDDPTDPPLPPLPTASEIPHASSSFLGDINLLLTNFSSVISAHPELSEGIHNILNNASNGTYWQAHRNAMSQAAQGIARETETAAEGLREAEAEAARRVAGALGGIFRALSEAMRPAQDNFTPVTPEIPSSSEPAVNPLDANGSETAPKAKDTHSHPPDDNIFDESPTESSTSHPRNNTWMHHGFGRGHRASFPSHPPFFPHHGPYSARPGSWRGWGVPPPPPPSFHHPGPPPPPGQYHPGYPPPHRPTPPLFPPPPGVYPFATPPAPVDTREVSNPALTNTLDELRAQVHEAKARYNAEKEKHRLQREDLRKGQAKRAQAPEINTATLPDSPTAAPESPVIAVQGRGGEPTHEVVSVHRHNTHTGHSYASKRRGPSHNHNDLRSRAIHRITKRLADMGFSENTHPELPSKIKAQLPMDGIVKNDSEDDIVTTLLEDLLALSPKSPVASGSGVKNVPGTWY